MRLVPLNLGVCDDCRLVQEVILGSEGETAPCRECGHYVHRIVASAETSFGSVKFFTQEED